MAVIIAKNMTVSELSIDDLAGQVIASGASFILSDYYLFNEIIASSDLKDLVDNGSIVINDGKKDLNSVQGLKRLTEVTKDELGLEIYKNGTIVSEEAEKLNFLNADVYDSTSGIVIEFPVGKSEPGAIQIRKTSSLELTNSWNDITFDTTDEETDSSVIEHDDSNTDNIKINEDGLFEIQINTTLRTTTSTKTTYYRFRKNDTTVISGSEFEVDLYPDETHEISRTIIVSLLEDDFLTLQMYTESNTGTTTMLEGASIIAKSLNGVKGIDGNDGLPGERGPQGYPGSGSTINVLKDDIAEALQISNINFEGNVEVTQDSTSSVTINILNTPAAEDKLEIKNNDTQISDDVQSINFSGDIQVTEDSTSDVTVSLSLPVFGTKFHEASSDTESSTTSTTYQQKLRLTTTDLPSSAKYRIAWYYEWQHTDYRNDFRARVQINDSTTIMEHRQEPQDSGTDQWHSCSGFAYTTESGILNIDLDYNSSSSSDTSSIRRAKLELWRVS